MSIVSQNPAIVESVYRDLCSALSMVCDGGRETDDRQKTLGSLDEAQYGSPRGRCTLGHLVGALACALREVGIDSPRQEAAWLVCCVLDIDRLQPIVAPETAVHAPQLAKILHAAYQRLERKPLSKILGKKEFYGRSFVVTPHVLDPRPDSEVLIDAVLAWTGDSSNTPSDYTTPQDTQGSGWRILDLGTGSGCWLITLLAELPLATGVGVDISPEALEIARRNADNHGVASRCAFVESDWFSAVPTSPCLQEPFTLVVSNPPYITLTDLPTLEPEVRCHDPEIALNGGEDGLKAYRNIAKISHHVPLARGTAFFVEIGAGQKDHVISMMESHGFRYDTALLDLAGHVRGLQFLVDAHI